MTTPFDPNATDFGTDVALLDDLQPVWGLASDDLNYAMASARHLTQREGSMDFYDPTYRCFDIRGYLSSRMDKAKVSALQGKIAATQVSDPRTLRSRATVTFDSVTESLLIAVDNDTATGPFALVLRASSITVDILSVNGTTLPEPVSVTGAPVVGTGGIIIVTGSGGSTPGPPGPPGTSNPSRSFGLQPVEDSSGTETPQLQTQLVINWGALGSSLTVEVAGAGMCDSGSAQFILRVGGGDGGIDGTAVCTLTAASSSYTDIHDSAIITNPGGYSRAIMTVTSPGAGVAARMRDITLTIQSN